MLSTLAPIESHILWRKQLRNVAHSCSMHSINCGTYVLVRSKILKIRWMIHR